MEKDNEVSGDGNSYTTLFRQYDPRIGRWLSIDPKANALESPYVGMGNNPLFYNDPFGDTIKVSEATKNNAGYQKWKKSKAGKKFLRQYGVGGINEDINVEIIMRKAGNVTQEGRVTDGSGLTETFVGGKKLVSEETYNRFKVQGKDVSKYTTSSSGGQIEFKIQFLSNENTDSRDVGSTIIHESQHVRIGMYTKKIYDDLLFYTSDQEHIIMLNNYSSPGYYTQKYEPKWSMPRGNGIADFNSERWQYYNQFRRKGETNLDIDKKTYESGESTLGYH